MVEDLIESKVVKGRVFFNEKLTVYVNEPKHQIKSLS